MEGLTSLRGILAFYSIVVPAGSRVPRDRMVGRGVPPSRRMESRHLGGLLGILPVDSYANGSTAQKYTLSVRRSNPENAV